MEIHISSVNRTPIFHHLLFQNLGNYTVIIRFLHSDETVVVFLI